MEKQESIFKEIKKELFSQELQKALKDPKNENKTKEEITKKVGEQVDQIYKPLSVKEKRYQVLLHL